MTAGLSGVDVAEGRGLQAAWDRLETARSDAAEAERAAFERWQDAYGAYEVIRDEASAAWQAWSEAIA